MKYQFPAQENFESTPLHRNKYNLSYYGRLAIYRNHYDASGISRTASSIVNGSNYRQLDTNISKSRTPEILAFFDLDFCQRIWSSERRLEFRFQKSID